jgi:polysaccharide biosynthesis/export protein
MSIRVSAITKVKKTVGQPLVTQIALAFALVLAVAGLRPLEAQGPAQNSTSSSSTPPSTTAKTLPAVVSGGYLIEPEDILDLYVYDVPELSRDYLVSSAGSVTVPLLPKPVQAAGLSPDQFAGALEENFRQAGSLSHPHITVTVKQTKRSVVTVDGAVKTPQSVPVIGQTSLIAVLSQSGGLADDAGSTATITRGPLAPHDSGPASGTTLPVVSVNLKKLMDGGDSSPQLDVWPGDRVSVEHAGVFYVMGEVNHPGGFGLKSAQEQVTVLQALAIAGDTTSVAKKNKAVIIRKDAAAANGRREIALNVSDIIAGRSPDNALQANDILYIPSSGGKRAAHAIAQTVQTVAGGGGTAIVYRY